LSGLILSPIEELWSLLGGKARSAMVRVTWAACLAWVLTAKHRQQCILEFIDSELHISIIIDTYVVGIHLQILIVCWIQDLKPQLNSARERFEIWVIFVSTEKVSVKDGVAKKVALIVHWDIIENSPARSHLFVDLGDFLGHLDNNTGIKRQIIVCIERKSHI
jgi:hypothetical protein